MPDVPITREMRERAWEMAQKARMRMGERCGAINAKYRELKDQRIRQHHERWNALREERSILLAAQPRNFDALAACEQAMRDHRKAPVPTTDDLEQARVAECQEEDRVLAAELDELRRKRDAGELVDNGCYV